MSRGARPQKVHQKILVILAFFAVIAKIENPMPTILNLALLRLKGLMLW